MTEERICFCPKCNRTKKLKHDYELCYATTCKCGTMMMKLDDEKEILK